MKSFVESFHVTVVGQVRRPNTYQISNTSSLLNVLNLAGGQTERADSEKIVIIRDHIQIRVNLEKLLEQGDLSALPPLRGGDVIRVPTIKTSSLRAVFGVVRDAVTIASVLLLSMRVF